MSLSSVTLTCNSEPSTVRGGFRESWVVMLAGSSKISSVEKSVRDKHQGPITLGQVVISGRRGGEGLLFLTSCYTIQYGEILLTRLIGFSVQVECQT